MTDISSIITALATQLRTIDDPYLQVVEDPNSEVIPPAILIDGPDVQVATNLAESDYTETYNLVLIAPEADLISARRLLHEYLSTSGTKSVRACLEADPTLGGVVSDLEIISITPPGLVFPPDESDAAPFYGAGLILEIDYA